MLGRSVAVQDIVRALAFTLSEMGSHQWILNEGMAHIFYNAHCFF